MRSLATVRQPHQMDSPALDLWPPTSRALQRNFCARVTRRTPFVPSATCWPISASGSSDASCLWQHLMKVD